MSITANKALPHNRCYAHGALRACAADELHYVTHDAIPCAHSEGSSLKTALVQYRNVSSPMIGACLAYSVCSHSNSAVASLRHPSRQSDRNMRVMRRKL